VASSKKMRTERQKNTDQLIIQLL